MHTYKVATCKNPILNGISPVNWLQDKSLALTEDIRKVKKRIRTRYGKVKQLDYIQDLEGSTIAYVLWNTSCQAIVSHITTEQEENNHISTQKCTFFRTWIIKESDCGTYKYHSPVNWHRSGDSEPTKLFPLKPLLNGKGKKGKVNKIRSMISQIEIELKT